MEHPELRIKSVHSVYEPAEDSYLAADALWSYLEASPHGGLSVLDMGTGSGILGLTAAANRNVARVKLADLNRQAITLSIGNLKLNAQKIAARCEFVESNLFSAIKEDERFDLIVFNPPYLPKDGDEKGSEQAWYGGADGIEVTIEFLNGAVAHLTPDGAILIVSSSFANREKLLVSIKSVGLHVQSEARRHLFFEDIYASILKKS